MSTDPFRRALLAAGIAVLPLVATACPDDQEDATEPTGATGLTGLTGVTGATGPTG